MNKGHIFFYIDDLIPLEFCGKVIGFEATDAGKFIVPFMIEPTTGDHDFNKCEGCKQNLEKLTSDLVNDFTGKGKKMPFPLCCTFHSNLVKLKEYKRDFFVSVPEMTAKKIIYTHQHILNNHSSENWYKIITDYIEWIILSFGTMPKNCGYPLYLDAYFSCIRNMIEKADIPVDKKTRILDYLVEQQSPPKNNSDTTDLRILLAAYEKWYKAFPFDLNSYFGNLKQHYEHKFPFLNGKPEVNMFSGLATGRLHTKTSLFEALLNLTNTLLTQINGATLYEKRLITDGNKIKLELLISERKSKVNQGYKTDPKDEVLQYRKMINEWFDDEMKFITNLTPLLSVTPPVEPKLPPHFQLKNNFNRVPIAKTFEHFNKGLVQPGYMASEDLTAFMKLAFEEKRIPETRFKFIELPPKYRVMKIFHNYYKNVAGKPHGKQKQYAALLGDYFEGFTTENVRTNFNKNY